MSVTVDATRFTADGYYPTADGYFPAISADIFEPVGGLVTADTTLYCTDATWPTADGYFPGGALDFTDALVIAAGAAIAVEAANAVDVLDAEVISFPIEEGGGGYYRPPQLFPVEGRGYGILPQLEGEAFGAVGVVGDAVGTLPRLGGAAEGAVGVAGRSAGQLRLDIRAVAVGNVGQVGAADAVLKSLSIASVGAVAVQGSASGAIVKLTATASGQHDDDEAAVMAFLLAA